jgi:hypothetical protein
MDLLFGGGAVKGNTVTVAKVKEWVRERCQLPDDAVVMVTELRCAEPGCPPIETVIAILGAPGGRRQFRIHQEVADVTLEDIAAIVV